MCNVFRGRVGRVGVGSSLETRNGGIVYQNRVKNARAKSEQQQDDAKIRSGGQADDSTHQEGKDGQTNTLLDRRWAALL